MSMKTDVLKKTFDRHLDILQAEVRRHLEQDHKLDITTASMILESYFSVDFLPAWYFLSTKPSEIAGHFVIMSQLLDANREYCTQVSDDGRAITYFLNIGRDFPGRLEKIISENIDMGISSFDSVKTSSGLRIITIEKKGKKGGAFLLYDRQTLDKMMWSINFFGEKQGYSHTQDFLKCLDDNYFSEEINNPLYPLRIQRHLKMFEDTITDGCISITVEDTSKEVDSDKLDISEIRVSAGIMNPEVLSVIRILDYFKNKGISLNRSYYDLFSHSDLSYSVGVISLYIPGTTKVAGIADNLKKTFTPTSAAACAPARKVRIEEKLEELVRSLSDPDLPKERVHETVMGLKELIRTNTDLSDTNEIGDFLLNSFSDFMEGLKFLGLDENDDIIRLFLSFDHFDEFYVLSKNKGELSHKPGFRTKHNSLRGKAYKGGLRIDPIVEFVEVAALAFMMTWKCARSKILFGGGKGGLILNPKDFDESIDFFDTLASFGRSLFLVTGPSWDVPAGDVGCGAAEIGDMFEGFKSALRDLALLASGIKKSLSIIGDRVISVEEARHILSKNFDVAPYDMQILHELITSERYLELVAAPQITGKPRMGIAARAGATGRGLCYSILAMATNMFLKGQWPVSEKLSKAEHALLEKAAAITEKVILEKKGADVITDDEWRILTTEIYVKLLKGKKVIVQGSGKVGGALLQELKRYGVNVTAVADAGGAVIGENLDVDELMKAVSGSASHPERKLRFSVMHAEKNVTQKIFGAREGSSVLEMECDILVPAALENAVTVHNADKIKAKIIACGSNGPHTSKAEIILNKRGITVIYDFLANQGGVNASYFEWLRNLTERFRYEAEKIYKKEFNPDVLDEYIMPEFLDRIKRILLSDESPAITNEWNKVMRDINFSAINEDYAFSNKYGIPMKTAGFINTQLRVLTAYLMKSSETERERIWDSLDKKVKELIRPFVEHPEARLHNDAADRVVRELYEAKKHKGLKK
jgi:glutamate dehydrogenase/leucine dehydrogenase